MWYGSTGRKSRILPATKPTFSLSIPLTATTVPIPSLPKFKSLMLHLWDKAKHFIQKAFTIILASTIIIWFVSHFSFEWKFLSDELIEESILANIGKLIQPIFTPLGFGSQLQTFGWVFVVASLTGLIAKENMIATLGTLAGCIVLGFEGDEEGIEALAIMIEATKITVPALISLIAFNMLTIPCFAAVATAKAELPKDKFVSTLIFWVVVSFVVSMMIYLIGTFFWTAFIFLALIILVILGIKIYNKANPVKKA